ncbi:MAG: hypothetical protein AB1778_07685 [Candidatus Bipolaricaulota bacterium]
MMHRTGMSLVVWLAILFSVAAPVAASDLGFSANVGLEIAFAPVPPASYTLASDLCLSFALPGFSLASCTAFDLAGFVGEEVTIAVDAGPVKVGEEMRFAPGFTWNELSLDLCIVGVQIGLDWILGNLGSVQTPEFTMGMVVSLSSEVASGFALASLTGFGAVDLVQKLGGAAAPFAWDWLSLFRHLEAIAEPDAVFDVTLVPGFTFSEALVRLTVDFCGMVASQTTWFDVGGLAAMQFELGYRFDDPPLRFATGASLDASFSITGLTFVVDLEIGGVQATSWTVFAEPTFPFPLSIVFERQGFAVAFDVCGVTVTSETDFDGAFMFAAEKVAIEATLAPVTFRSLTVFDASGFTAEILRAEVGFSGVVLFTRAEFSWSGIDLAAFGFELLF